jgi:hypothetical protein
MPDASSPPSAEALQALHNWLLSFAEKTAARSQADLGSATEPRRTRGAVERRQLPVFNLYSANREATELYRGRVEPRVSQLMRSLPHRLTDIESAELRLKAFDLEFSPQTQTQTEPTPQ